MADAACVVAVDTSTNNGLAPDAVVDNSTPALCMNGTPTTRCPAHKAFTMAGRSPGPIERLPITRADMLPQALPRSL